MSHRRIRVALGSTVALTVALTADPTLAMGLVNGSTFWLGLECNNDVIGHVVGNNDPINGWQYTSDAAGDNTDGHFYDILGLAQRETEDEIIFAINANMPYAGAGFDRDGNSVTFGDLFFASGNQSLDEAMGAGNLYGIRFAQNEAGVNELGVYSGVTAKSVAVNNFGHRTLNNYASLVDSNVNNFAGDLQTADLQNGNGFIDPDGTGYNVIDRGTKVGNDGFELLDNAVLAELGFDSGNFANQGDNIIAFKINKAALQAQLPLEEQANQLDIPWQQEWVDGFDRLDGDIAQNQEESKRVNNEEIKPRNKENSDIRNGTVGHEAALRLRNERNKRRNLERNLGKAENELQDVEESIARQEQKYEYWASLSPEEQASAPPEVVWTSKDKKFLESQQEEAQTLRQRIAQEIPAAIAEVESGEPLIAILQNRLDRNARTQRNLEAKRDNPRRNLTTAEQERLAFLEAENANLDGEIANIRNSGNIASRLNGAQAAYNGVLNQIRDDNPGYRQREEEVVTFRAEKKVYDDAVKAAKGERTDLENTIRALLTARREEIVANNAAAEEALEIATGGPRTSAESGIPTTPEELERLLGNGGEDTIDVPEPTAGLGLLATGLILGGLRLRRRVARK